MTVRSQHTGIPLTITSIPTEICKSNSRTRVVPANNNSSHTPSCPIRQHPHLSGPPAAISRLLPAPNLSLTSTVFSITTLHDQNTRSCVHGGHDAKWNQGKTTDSGLASLEDHSGRRSTELAKLTFFSFKVFFIPLPLLFHFQHSDNGLINWSLWRLLVFPRRLLEKKLILPKLTITGTPQET